MLHKFACLSKNVVFDGQVYMDVNIDGLPCVQFHVVSGFSGRLLRLGVVEFGHAYSSWRRHDSCWEQMLGWGLQREQQVLRDTRLSSVRV